MILLSNYMVVSFQKKEVVIKNLGIIHSYLSKSSYLTTSVLLTTYSLVRTSEPYACDT